MPQILVVCIGTSQLQVKKFETLKIVIDNTFSGGIGNWSTDGCNTSAAGSEYPSNVTCYCDHLTNFAVIVVSH